MNQLKKYLGILWITIAVGAIAALMVGAVRNIDLNGKADINKPIPWVIIISIFTPIACGLIIFGWYAFRGEYDKEKFSD